MTISLDWTLLINNFSRYKCYSTSILLFKGRVQSQGKVLLDLLTRRQIWSWSLKWREWRGWVQNYKQLWRVYCVCFKISKDTIVLYPRRSLVGEFTPAWRHPTPLLIPFPVSLSEASFGWSGLIALTMRCDCSHKKRETTCIVSTMSTRSRDHSASNAWIVAHCHSRISPHAE